MKALRQKLSSVVVVTITVGFVGQLSACGRPNSDDDSSDDVALDQPLPNVIGNTTDQLPVNMQPDAIENELDDADEVDEVEVPQDGAPCGEGWGETIPGNVDIGLASNPEVKGVIGGTADERRLLDEMNVEREAAGLPVLIWSDQLANVGRSHAADMNQLEYYDHGSTTANNDNGQDNWLTYQRLDFVYPGDFSGSGENLMSGIPVGDTVQGWMDSPSHKAAILDEWGPTTHGGVGIGPDGWFIVFVPASCAH